MSEFLLVEQEEQQLPKKVSQPARSVGKPVVQTHLVEELGRVVQQN